MEKRWVYTLMAFAVIGMVIAIGSVATAALSAGGKEAGIASGSVSPAGTVFTTYTVGQYIQFYAVTYPADNTSTLVYTVPANARFKIDEIIMSNAATTGVSSNYVYRGPTGWNWVIVKWLKPSDGFQQTFNGLELASGEQLRIRTFNSGVTAGTTWTITGHLI